MKTSVRVNDFSKGSVVKNILTLAVPMTLAQFINILYSIVDRIFIGQMPENSTMSLTGIGLSFPIITVVMAFANLFGMGGAPLCSIERGKGDDDEAEKIMGNSFMMMLLCGIVITVLFIAFRRPLLYLFGASDATYPYADAYSTIYLSGSIFVMVGLGMNCFINSQGFGRTGMLTVLLGAVANVVLDYLFIFRWNMGVRGAAFATVISQFLSAVWILRFLTGKKTILRLKTSCMKLSAKRVKAIVSLGLSGFSMAITDGVVQIFCNSTLRICGGDLYVGIMTILSSIREVARLPVRGITNSAQPFLGFNYGAKEYERVKKGIVFVSVAPLFYAVFIWFLIQSFPEFFIRIFNQEPAIIEAGIPAVRLYFLGFIVMSLQFSGQSVFVGLGKAKYAVFFAVFRKLVIGVPSIFLFTGLLGMGPAGVIASEPVSHVIGGIACFGTMLLVVWPELSALQKKQNARRGRAEKIRIVPASETDIKEASDLIQTVYEKTEKKEWFVTDGPEELRRMVRPGGGLLYLAVDEETGKTAAVLGALIPPEKENLAYEAGLPDDEIRVSAHIETAAVLPEYRGLGLQRRMTELAEKELYRMGYRYLFSTVHPDNAFSRGNMEKMGFHRVKQCEMYGGLPREIMRKEL